MRRNGVLSLAVVILMPICSYGQVGRLLQTLCGPPTPGQTCQYDPNDNWVRTFTALKRARELQPANARFYLALGVAYLSAKNTDVEETKRQSARTEFEQGRQRFPTDSRFPLALGALSLLEGKTDAALEDFRIARAMDPTLSLDSFALETLSLGNDPVNALKLWNRGGNDTPPGPQVSSFQAPAGWIGSLLQPPPTLFEPGHWKTAESRLDASQGYNWVRLRADAAPGGDPSKRKYDLKVESEPKKSDITALFSLAGALIPRHETASLSLSNIDGLTGFHWKSKYRYQSSRRRGDSTVQLALPSPFWGTAFLEFGGTWRSEYWDIHSIANDAYQSDAEFLYKSTSVRADVKFIPNHRIDIHGGVSYSNRAARGRIAPLALDSRNIGKFHAGTQVQLLDRWIQTRLSVDGFASGQSVLGDFDFKGGTAKLHNDIQVAGAVLNVTASGGTSSGAVPLDEYFMLGFPSAYAVGEMRAHSVAKESRKHLLGKAHYGDGLMGTEFVLGNVSLTREVWRSPGIPIFNVFYLPSISVKPFAFFDVGKTTDRFHVFKNSGWTRDAGIGVDLGFVRIWVGKVLGGGDWAFGNASPF